MISRPKEHQLSIAIEGRREQHILDVLSAAFDSSVLRPPSYKQSYCAPAGEPLSITYSSINSLFTYVFFHKLTFYVRFSCPFFVRSLRSSITSPRRWLVKDMALRDVRRGKIVLYPATRPVDVATF